MASSNIESVTWESREALGNYYKDRVRFTVTADAAVVVESRFNNVKAARLVGYNLGRRNNAIALNSDDGTAGTNSGHVHIGDTSLDAADVLILELWGV